MTRPEPSIRPLAPREWRTYRALRLRCLADSPEAFGSTLADERERPDAVWQDRLATDRAMALPLIAEVDGEPVGLAWGRIHPEEPLAVHVYQMWVAPEARGLGIGQRLLGAIVEWARARGGECVLLGVMVGNAAAERLYVRAGFVTTGETEPLRPGSSRLSQTMRLDLSPEASGESATVSFSTRTPLTQVTPSSSIPPLAARPMPDTYLDATQDAGRQFVMRGIQGPIVMLNLLRFRETADYSSAPHLAPEASISGREAYARYIAHTLPFLHEAGGEVLFSGEAGPFLIGPPEETWDRALLVRHASVEVFLAFAANEAYLAGTGHRTAALADSRLLPLT